ncbi:hypothetical protein GGH19_004667 [Coemansia sp. RSA 1807]|nr:hypothetical protein LPJ54_000953 [Coemansia sp. RSA 1824]KAJ2151636.1 hypothetical protein J3F82_003211 [Coemansia sp. RSA 637]KAJ2405160.1 hypothetical protein J3F80_004374 [Coemansia sp. RSA 2526]KAJ2572706.1 hypothetical protein GGH19_004667 [Coemansia sp. RSA 1807]KAJ2584325.1 hypothetical protein IWW49_005036 [Coemansia sp. RSA 1797]
MNSLPGGPESKSALRHSGSDSSTSGIALQVLNSAGVAKTKPQTQSVHSNGSTSETGSFATADNIASDSGAGAQSRVANSDTRVSIDEHAQPTPGTSILTCPSSLHSGRQERQSWWQRLRGVLNRVRLMTRIKLLILTPLAYAQIIVGIVILGLSTHETTDQPLRAFMILHIVRLFLYYPLYISHKLWPHRVEARGAGFKSWHKW